MKRLMATVNGFPLLIGFVNDTGGRITLTQILKELVEKGVNFTPLKYTVGNTTFLELIVNNNFLLFNLPAVEVPVTEKSLEILKDTLTEINKVIEGKTIQSVDVISLYKNYHEKGIHLLPSIEKDYQGIILQNVKTNEEFAKLLLTLKEKEKLRVEAESKVLNAQLAFKKEEQERLEKERLEKERLEKERLEKERLEKEKLEQEKLEQEKLEQEEKERLEKEEQEKLEQERLEKEKLEQEKLEQEKLEKEKLEQEEKERLEQERLEQERLEQEEKERLEQEEKERLEQEEKERLAKIEQEKLIQIEKERLERLEKEKEQKELEETEIIKIENIEDTKNISNEITFGTKPQENINVETSEEDLDTIQKILRKEEYEDFAKYDEYFSEEESNERKQILMSIFEGHQFLMDNYKTLSTLTKFFPMAKYSEAIGFMKNLKLEIDNPIALLATKIKRAIDAVCEKDIKIYQESSVLLLMNDLALLSFKDYVNNTLSVKTLDSIKQKNMTHLEGIINGLLENEDFYSFDESRDSSDLELKAGQSDDDDEGEADDKAKDKAKDLYFTALDIYQTRTLPKVSKPSATEIGKRVQHPKLEKLLETGDLTYFILDESINQPLNYLENIFKDNKAYLEQLYRYKVVNNVKTGRMFYYSFIEYIFGKSIKDLESFVKIIPSKITITDGVFVGEIMNKDLSISKPSVVIDNYLMRMYSDTVLLNPFVIVSGISMKQKALNDLDYDNATIERINRELVRNVLDPNSKEAREKASEKQISMKRIKESKLLLSTLNYNEVLFNLQKHQTPNPLMEYVFALSDTLPIDISSGWDLTVARNIRVIINSKRAENNPDKIVMYPKKGEENSSKIIALNNAIEIVSKSEDCLGFYTIRDNKRDEIYVVNKILDNKTLEFLDATLNPEIYKINRKELDLVEYKLNVEENNQFKYYLINITRIDGNSIAENILEISTNAEKRKLGNPELFSTRLGDGGILKVKEFPVTLNNKGYTAEKISTLKSRYIITRTSEILKSKSAKK